MNVHILLPGQQACRYHQESAQEDFLVLAGECLLIVEEQERPLRQWDFVHCPGGTRHVFVGAGEGPCAVLMIGARPEPTDIHYPVSEVAGRHGASVDDTDRRAARGVCRLAGPLGADDHPVADAVGLPELGRVDRPASAVPDTRLSPGSGSPTPTRRGSCTTGGISRTSTTPGPSITGISGTSPWTVPSS